MTDVATRYTRTAVLRSKDATVVVPAILKWIEASKVVVDHYARVLNLGNGPEFNNKILETLCAKNGIVQRCLQRYQCCKARARNSCEDYRGVASR